MKRIVFLLLCILQNQLLFPQNFNISTQEEIDSFQVNHPGLTACGILWIGGSNIYNLEGLSSITSVGELLVIEQCENLTSLSGLENLNYIGIAAGLGLGLSINDNNALTNLQGLNNLTTIAGRLDIYGNASLKSLSGLENLTTLGDGLNIGPNPVLKSLNGLSNLTTVGVDGIIIYNNDQLTNLVGLHTIDGGAVEYIKIMDNDVLSTCHVQSICDYLVSPNGITYIVNNAPGCNNVAEVEEACEIVGFEQNNSFSSLTIHPNPTDIGIVNIGIKSDQNNLYLACFNIFGQQVHQQKLRSSKRMIYVGTWPPGIYLAVVYEEGKPVGKAKFVVIR